MIFQRSTSTTNDGEKRYRTLSCSREGLRTSRSKNEFHMKPTSEKNCKGRISVIVRLDEKCLVNSLFFQA